MSTDLTRTLDATAALVDGIRDDQWDAPTPCPDWTVRELLDHVVAGNLGFVAALTGEPPADPTGVTYRESGVRLAEAFARPGTTDRAVTVPFGTVPGAVALHLRLTELLVHGWDLARATGQSTNGLPDDVAEVEHAFSVDALAQLPAERSPFAPPQPVADGAPAIDRLAALLGRRPTPVAGGV